MEVPTIMTASNGPVLAHGDNNLTRGSRKPLKDNFYQDIWRKSPDNWPIVGVGEELVQCGAFSKFLFCPEHVEATQLVLRNCKRLSCPTCWPGAVSDRADRIESRLKEVYSLNSMIFRHISINPPVDSTPENFDFPKFKQLCLNILEEITYGGVVFFHPDRFDKINETKHWGPHFHAIVQSGFIDGKKLSKKYKCTIKSHKWVDFNPTEDDFYSKWKLKDDCAVKTNPYFVSKVAGHSLIRRKISYILSHAGLHFSEFKRKPESRFKRIIRQDNCYWFFGSCGNRYRIYKTVKVPNDVIRCPVCKSDLVENSNGNYSDMITTEIEYESGDKEQIFLGKTCFKIQYKAIISASDFSKQSLTFRKIKLLMEPPPRWFTLKHATSLIRLYYWAEEFENYHDG